MMKIGDRCPHCRDGELFKVIGRFDTYLVCDSCESTYVGDFEESEEKPCK